MCHCLLLIQTQARVWSQTRAVFSEGVNDVQTDFYHPVGVSPFMCLSVLCHRTESQTQVLETQGYLKHLQGASNTRCSSVCAHVWVCVCVWLIRSGGQWINGPEYKAEQHLCWCRLLNAKFSLQSSSLKHDKWVRELTGAAVSYFHCFPLGWALQKLPLLTSREVTRGRKWWRRYFVLRAFYVVSHKMKVASSSLIFSPPNAGCVHAVLPAALTWQMDVGCSWLSRENHWRSL